jgi:hypothetical protein
VLSYILPIKAAVPADELTSYLRWLVPRCQVLVVDGSAPNVFAEHHRLWCEIVEHVPVDTDLVTPMGKVGGVLTGLRRAVHPKIVIADDDIRYSSAALHRLERLLDHAEIVRPQNYFVDLPWHCRWDTARTLIARAFGADWPGTLGIDRDALLAAGGYRGDVMFENLELARTLEAAGSRHLVADDLFVARLPPTTRQFWSQRVRQAYDEFARPAHAVLSLAIAPILLLGRRKAILAITASSVLVAECGRRRNGGRAVFGPTASLWAPIWTAERAVTIWLAVLQRLAGGVRYGSQRLPDAASTRRALRRRALAPVQSSEALLQDGGRRVFPSVEQLRALWRPHAAPLDRT